MNSVHLVQKTSSSPPVKLAVVASESVLYVFSDGSAPTKLECPNASDAKVTAVYVHPDGLYAVAAFSNKQVCVWSLPDGSFISSAKVHKQSTSLALGSVTLSDGSRRDVLVTSDRGGEAWGLDFPALSGQVLLLGHTASIISEVLISSDSKRIISADRDEKIRVTNFPQTDSIHGFCLGHSNVVTSIAFTDNTSKFLVSCGWDNTMRLWNVETCSLLDTITFPSQESTAGPASDGEDEPAEAVAVGEEGDAAPEAEADDEVAQDRVYDATEAGNFPTKIACFPMSHGRSLIAVAFWGLSTVRFYVVHHHEDGRVEFKRSNDSSVIALDVALPSPPCDIQFMKKDDSNDEITAIVLLSSSSAESNARGLFKSFRCVLSDANDSAAVSVVETNISASSSTAESQIYQVAEYFKAQESFRPVQKSIAVSEHMPEHSQAFTRHALDRRFNSTMIPTVRKNKKAKTESEA